MDHLAEQLGATKSPAEVAQTVRKAAQDLSLGVESDEHGDTWGTIVSATKPFNSRTLSSNVHGWGTQAYPIQLPAPSVIDCEVDFASLQSAWLALADP